jgi:hypothetical protein
MPTATNRPSRSSIEISASSKRSANARATAIVLTIEKEILKLAKQKNWADKLADLLARYRVNAVLTGWDYVGVGTVCMFGLMYLCAWVLDANSAYRKVEVKLCQKLNTD